MKITRLTKEHLPAFIYLTDQILDHDFTSERAEIDNMYQIIADEGILNSHETITDRTIRRAFNLRKNLRAGRILKKDFNKPEIKTLNALTYFHFKTRFKIFIETHKEEIATHYKVHKPSEEVVNLIFVEVPEKLDFIQRNKEKLEDFVILIANQKFETLKEELIEANSRFEAFEKKVTNSQKLQSDLLDELQGRINELERKRKKASFVYRFFGAFGLFFVAIDYREADLKNFLEDYMNDYEGLSEDTILDEIL